MEKNQMWTVVGIALVVAVVASVVTVELIGNSSPSLSPIMNSDQVINLLKNNCKMVFQGANGVNVKFGTGNDFCAAQVPGSKCIFGDILQMGRVAILPNQLNLNMGELVSATNLVDCSNGISKGSMGSITKEGINTTVFTTNWLCCKP